MFKQVPTTDAMGTAYDLPTCVLDVTAPELAAKFNLVFEIGSEDGLGEVHYALIDFQGTKVWLMFYKEAPQPFTELKFPDKQPNLGQLLTELCKELDVTPSWVSPLI